MGHGGGLSLKDGSVYNRQVKNAVKDHDKQVLGTVFVSRYSIVSLNNMHYHSKSTAECIWKHYVP